MDIELGRSYKTKLLVAVGATASVESIVDYDGDAAEHELHVVGGSAGEWGLRPPSSMGLWVWEGAIGYPHHDDGDGYEPTFDGVWRRATADEAANYACGIAVWRKAPVSAEEQR